MPVALSNIMAFVVELGALAAYARWGASQFDAPVLSALAALAVAGLVALLWSIFAAPKSPTRLPSHGLLAFKILVYSGAAAALISVGSFSVGMLFASIAATHLFLASCLRIL